MSDLLHAVEESVSQHRLLRPGRGVLVAVSGGVDSMVLLDLLHRLSRKHQWKLTVAHFNHQLRGRASEADAQLVARTAARLKLPLATECWSDKDSAQIKQLGLEMAARLARHDFLGRTAEHLGIRVVATAHHADDQVELFFLRLLRGAGGEGLGGMKATGTVAGHPRIALVRPLLEQTKADICAHARAARVRFREDASNASEDFLRNRIRRELLPLLARRYEPAVARIVLRAMDVLREDAAFVKATAAAWLRRKRPSLFEKLHPAVQRQCLRQQLAALGVTPTYDLVETLRLTPGKFATANGHKSFARDAAGRIKRRRQQETTFNVGEVSVALTGARGRCCLGLVKIIWQTRRVAGRFHRPQPTAGRELFDADKLGASVRLRHWRQGDRFQPIGMSAPVKLQDLFTNLKISRDRRHQLLVATARRGEIFWVEGLRIGERFKLVEATRRKLEWRWHRETA